MSLTFADAKNLAELTAELNLSDGEARIVAALLESFGSIADDETIDDTAREAELQKSAKEFIAYTKGGDDAASIANLVLAKVRARPKRRKKLVQFAPSAPELAMVNKVTKSVIYSKLEELAEDIRKADPKLTKAAAFEKLITTTELGRQGYRAYREVPADTPAAAQAATPASRDTELPAYQAIAKRAGELQRAFPKLSDSAAFAKVYEDPSSEALREKLRQERAALAA